MPELNVIIGGRSFSVNCQEGEESFVQAAAQLLDNEAQPLVAAMGRLPEGKLLLMSGLMLADKTLAYEQERQQLYARIAELEARPAPPPETIEVEVVPIALAESLSEMALRAEALAEQLAYALNPVSAAPPLSAMPSTAQDAAQDAAQDKGAHIAAQDTALAQPEVPQAVDFAQAPSADPVGLPSSVAAAVRSGNDPVVFDPEA